MITPNSYKIMSGWDWEGNVQTKPDKKKLQKVPFKGWLNAALESEK